MDLCGAKLRDGSGGTCKKRAGWGTDHVGFGTCRNHGGSTPSLRLVAKKQQAAAAVATYGLPREVEPHQALIEELHRTAGHVAWLSVEVADLDRDDLTGPVGGGESSYPRYEPNVLVNMLTAERKHLTAVAKTCIDVGVEERRVRLAEQQGAFMASVLRGVLTDLGVRLDDPETERVVRRHLSAVV